MEIGYAFKNAVKRVHKYCSHLTDQGLGMIRLTPCRKKTPNIEKPWRCTSLLSTTICGSMDYRKQLRKDENLFASTASGTLDTTPVVSKQASNPNLKWYPAQTIQRTAFSAFMKMSIFGSRLFNLLYQIINDYSCF